MPTYLFQPCGKEGHATANVTAHQEGQHLALTGKGGTYREACSRVQVRHPNCHSNTAKVVHHLQAGGQGA